MRLRHFTTLATVTITALALTVPAGAQAETCPGAGTLPTPVTIAAAVDATLCLANQERAAVGAPPLSLDPSLSTMAGDYAQRMVTERFFSHTSPDGGGLADRFAAAGDDVEAGGENLYWGETSMGTPAATINGWMNSPEHRDNLLDPEFRRVGIGIALGAPKAVAGPAATIVADFDSGAPAVAHSSSVSSSRTTTTTHHRVRRAATPKAAVKAWFEAARLGDGQGFCRVQDNHLLQRLYSKTGRSGIRACVATFRAIPTMPAASQLHFAKVRTAGAKATGTVVAAGHAVPFSARRFNGHWKLHSLG